MTSSWRHKPPCNTHHEVMINRAKFDVWTFSSFRGVKAYIRTDRIALYKLDVIKCSGLQYVIELFFQKMNCLKTYVKPP